MTTLSPEQLGTAIMITVALIVVGTFAVYWDSLKEGV